MLRQAHMVGSVTAEGEIIEGVYAVIPARRKNGFSKGWYAMGTEPTGELIDLMITRKLQARDLMTLLAMLEALDLENFIQVSQTPSRALADESAERQQINQGPCHQQHPSDWPERWESQRPTDSAPSSAGRVEPSSTTPPYWRSAWRPRTFGGLSPATRTPSTL